MQSALLFAILLAAPAAAQRLPSTVVPEHYDLTFDVDIPHARFTGTERIRVRVGEPASRVVLHALDLQLQSVTMESGGSKQTATVTMNQADETATLRVAKPLAAGSATIEIAFAGTLNDKLRGFYLSKGKERDYAVPSSNRPTRAGRSPASTSRRSRPPSRSRSS
jgi:aminopeptidase N